MNITRLVRDEHGSLIFPVYRGASYFATRAAARAICQDIDKLPELENVVVDWTAIDAATGAFASEYMTWIIASPRLVTNANVSPQLRAEFDLAVQRLRADDV